MIRNVVSNAFVYIIGSGVTQFFSLLFTLMLMKEFTLEEYGTYSLIISFVALFTFIVDGGLTGYIIKEFNNKNFLLKVGCKERNIFISNVLFYQVIVTMILLLLYVSVVFLVANEVLIESYLIFGLLTLVLGFNTPVFALLIANGVRKVILIKDISTSVMRLLILIVGFNIGIDSNFVYYIPFVVVFIACITCFFFFKKLIIDFKFEYECLTSELTKIFKLVFPFLFLALVNILYNKIDVLMLSELSTISEVAFYSGATIFVYPFMFICSAASSAILPFFSKQVVASSYEAKKDEQSIFKIMFLIGAVLSSTLFFLSDIFYSRLFDGKYELSTDVYHILVWYLLIVFCYTSMSNFLVAHGKIKILIYMNLLMLAFNFGLNFLLIPIWGAKGAAFSTVISELIILLFLWSFINIKKNKIA